MTKLLPYMLICESDREQFVEVLDRTPMVRNWLTFLPNAVAFVSTHDAMTLVQYIRQNLPGKPFIFTPLVGSITGGYLPPNVWDFINNPKDSGKWPAPNSLVEPISAFQQLVTGLPRRDLSAGAIADFLYPKKDPKDQS